MNYCEYESAMERFSIMTIDGKIEDHTALKFIEKSYSKEIREKIERKIKNGKNNRRTNQENIDRVVRKRQGKVFAVD